uniref:U116-Liphistoxin-Lth1a_1 n=1 Tax=Liphistius thaleban TaxID=1905330 RepID=A0A4V2H8Q1_9ARAC
MIDLLLLCFLASSLILEEDHLVDLHCLCCFLLASSLGRVGALRSFSILVSSPWSTLHSCKPKPEGRKSGSISRGSCSFFTVSCFVIGLKTEVKQTQQRDADF